MIDRDRLWTWVAALVSLATPEPEGEPRRSTLSPDATFSDNDGRWPWSIKAGRGLWLLAVLEYTAVLCKMLVLRCRSPLDEKALELEVVDFRKEPEAVEIFLNVI